MTGASATITTLTQKQFVRQRRRRALVDFWRRLRQDRLVMLGLIVLIGFAVMALIAPWISPKSGLSATESIDNPLWAPPSRDFPLGTDNLGRSVAAQFVWGSRVSLVVGLAATKRKLHAHRAVIRCPLRGWLTIRIPCGADEDRLAGS